MPARGLLFGGIQRIAAMVLGMPGPGDYHGQSRYITWDHIGCDALHWQCLQGRYHSLAHEEAKAFYEKASADCEKETVCMAC